MTEIKDSTHKDLFPVSSGAALATCSEDASKNGGGGEKKACRLASVFHPNGREFI